MTGLPSGVIAPGARVVVRDAEWVVRRVDVSSDGGYQLTCDGVSELVRDHTAVFLTSIDREVEVLDPARTALVADSSERYQATLLYLESLLRQSAPSDERIHVGHRAAMDLVPYQLDPARQALGQPRQRILIADAVGLGKTLEAGVLLAELIARGRGKRILVLTVKSMLTQFQKELWNRFTIPLVRLDSAGIQRVRARIPTNHNPFYYYDRSIISIDTLKQDAEYRTYLEQAYWDVIVIDEAHNVADRGTGTQRARLARLLARRSDTLIMLSATPHDGRARSFASLVNMLDATAIADPDHYEREDFRHKGLVVRRFKKDIQSQVRQAFQDRQVYRVRHAASPEEEAAYQALLAVRVAGRTGAEDEPVAAAEDLFAPAPTSPDRSTRALRPRRDLFLVSLEKALFSSPAACLQSVRERIRRRQRLAESERPAGYAQEIDDLRTLEGAVERITTQRYGKYRALLRALREGEPFRWRPTDTRDRLVIFTERIETLRFLAGRLPEDLGLRPGQLEVLHGTMSDVDQQRVVEAFGHPESPMRVLVCSDVASEGINLHFLSHRLVHFDMPWSLMVFQQRNGRIDRYGQKAVPEIVYLITESANPTVRGDQRILEVLEAKDEQAYRNIGDPSAFMHVHDIDLEEAITARAIAEGRDAAEFDRALVPKSDEGEDLLSLFLGTTAPGAATVVTPASAETTEGLSLFADDFAYAAAAVEHLNRERERVQSAVDFSGRRITLTAPEDLRERFGYLPREVVPEHWQFVLSPEREVIRQEIERSRGDEAPWPKVCYLWPLNPVLAWLNDRMLAAFGRHQAPVVRYPQPMPPGETAFVLAGLIPNRKSHPLVQEWVAVAFRNGAFAGVEPFHELKTRLRLGEVPVPNRREPLDTGPLAALLPAAVERARAWMLERRTAFERATRPRLEAQLAELDRLRGRQLDLLERQLAASGQIEVFKESRRHQRQREIAEVFDEYRDWVRDTMTAEPHQYLQVLCVLVGSP